MLSTLIELQRLKTLERTGWMLRGLPQGSESVAAHSYGVAIAAMLLADAIKARGEAIDIERVVRMSLLHDWAETRVGDMPRTATEYFGRDARRRAEQSAFKDIVHGSGGDKLYAELHEEYEKRESLESRLVKAADVIDLLVQTLAFERAGARGLDEFWNGVEETDLQLEGTAREVVDDVLAQLTRARAELTRTSETNETGETGRG